VSAGVRWNEVHHAVLPCWVGALLGAVEILLRFDDRDDALV